MSTRCSAGVFIFLLAVVSAFDAITSSKWIENMAHGHRCGCVNLIFDYKWMTAARTVSRILSLSFRSSRVLSIEDYLDREGPSDCPTSLNVVLDHRNLRQIKFVNSVQEKWLIYANSTTNVEKLFEGIDVSYDSAMILVRPVANSSNLVELEDVYRVRKDYPLRVHQLGTLNVEEPIKDFYVMPIRMNLEGLHFKAGTNFAKPTSYQRNFVQDTGKEMVVEEGYIIDVFKALSESLNFKVTLKWYNEPMGTVVNGSWTGLAKRLNDEEIDVLLGAFNMSPERLDLVDFPGTLLLSRFQVFSLPLTTTSTMTTLLKPLHPDVWRMVAFWLLTVSLCLCLTLKLRKQFYMDNSPMPTNVAESVCFTTQALCQQAYSFIPRGISLRIIIFIAYITANTLVPSYSASLISSLTQRNAVSSFRNLEELAKMKFKLVVGVDSEDYKYLASAENSVIKALVENTIVVLRFSEQPAAIEETYKATLVEICRNYSRHAIFGDELYFDYATKSKELIRCRFVKMSQSQATLHQSFAFKRHSPYNDAFRLRLLQIRERGILSKFKHKYWIPQNPDTRLFTQVELSDVSPIFIIFGAGSAIGFLILIIEYLTHTRAIPIGPKRHLKRFDYFNQLMLSE